MKQLITIIILTFSAAIFSKDSSVFASSGDTTIVHGFSGLLHQNCNTGKGTFLFPADTTQYYRILLKYQLTCPTFGCDIYDRIATLKIERNTGAIDSTLTNFPSFKVDGNTMDSLQYMNDTSYSYTYNSQTQSIDSTANPSIEISYYGDTLDPSNVTAQLTVWPAYYSNYIVDSLGNFTDSTFVTPDSVIYVQYTSKYIEFDVKERIEIARVITPYGMAVDLWFDVTDYRSILSDSVTFVSNVCGYSNGWLVTNDFYFIEGVPPMNAFKITNLWNGTFAYGNVSDPIENHLQPITLTVDSTTVHEKIRLITTGHGFGGFPNQEVAEFYDVTHTLNIDGTDFDQHLWRSDCGSNPLYPQGAPGYTSTWFYKRANWCPGSYVTPHDYDATPFITQGGNFDVDYNMVPYTVTGGPSGFYAPEYYIQSQAIEYNAINYTNNASIERIVAPTDAFEYRRRNPICEGLNPMVVIKNNGASTLSSLVIHYSVDTGSVQSYTWTGALNLMDSTTVTLPPISFGAGSHTFTAYIDQPNGMADEFVYDDTLRSTFVPVNIYATTFVRILTKTDGSPNEVSWTVKDDQGTILFSRTNFPSPNTVYIDTVFLSTGCYSITAYDSFGDGVCCYNGTGLFRILKGNTATQIGTSGDYGDFYNVNFSIDNQVGVSELELPDFFLYPNPTTGSVRINTSFENPNSFVKVFDITGKEVYSTKLAINSFTTELDLSFLDNGLYLLQLESKGNRMSRRVLIQK